MFKRFVPLLGQTEGYNRALFQQDIVAGLTVGIMLIPQGMAYALIAGMPPIYGLYASLVPIFIYALFGSSRQLSVAPVAMMSLLTAAGVAPLAGDDVERYIALALLLALMVGIIQLSMGLLRFGFLTNFLSHPILAGFTSAAALIIGLSQLKHLLGIDLARSHHIHEIILQAFQRANEINSITVIIGIMCMAILMGLKAWKKSFPGALVVVLFSTLVVWILSLAGNGVKIVGAVPGGLPEFQIPALNWADLQALLPTALAISMVGFMESIAVAKVYATKKGYRLDANQELMGLGLANILGSLFQAFPTAGGFSRTAVNAQAGAQTQVAALVTTGIIGLTLLFLTPLFYYLPNAVLASIVMVAVFGLIDWKEALHLWKVDRKDFGLMMITFFATLGLGIEQGILVGVVASLLIVIHQSSTPHTAIEGRLPGTTSYRNVVRNPQALTDPGIVIFRMDAALYFANTAHFKDRIEEIKAANTPLNALILNFFPINHIDSSAAHILEEIIHDLQNEGTQVLIVGIKGPVRDVLVKAGLIELIGEENFFLEMHEAVVSVTSDSSKGESGRSDSRNATPLSIHV